MTQSSFNSDTLADYKLVVYTAVFGGYDVIRDPIDPPEGVAFYCFTDRPQRTEVWQPIVHPIDGTPALTARERKVLPHRSIPTASTWLWMDSNIQIHGDILSHLDEWLGDKEIAAVRHPDRDCIYQEAEACILLNKDRPFKIEEQVLEYKKDGYPEHNGLVETGFLIRRNTDRVRILNGLWWALIENGSHRDQLSFNYACWRLGIEYAEIPIELRRHPHIKFHRHVYQSRLRRLEVAYGIG